MGSSSHISPSSSTQPRAQNINPLRTNWLPLTLLVVGIIGILVGNFTLANTARYVTMIGGSLVCALALLGFSALPPKISYTSTKDFWKHVCPESEWKGDYNIFEALTANPRWFKELTPLPAMMCVLSWDNQNVKYGDEAFEKALIENVNFNATAAGENTALHIAAKMGRGGVAYLLHVTEKYHARSSLNVNFQNAKGETPLHLACKAYNDAVKATPANSQAAEYCAANILLLLRAKADPTLRTTAGLLPIEYLDDAHRQQFQDLKAALV